MSYIFGIVYNLIFGLNICGSHFTLHQTHNKCLYMQMKFATTQQE